MRSLGVAVALEGRESHGRDPVPKSGTSLGFFQANYCTLLLSSMADTVAPGSTYLSKCCSGHGNEVGMGFSLWPLIGAKARL